MAASLCSLALTPLVRSFARRVGAIDQPGARKIHSQPMPRLGGLSIFISYYLVLAVASRFDFFHFPADFFRTEHHAWIFLATGLVVGIGIVDDFRRLPPAFKFLVQVIAALVVALFCYRIEVVSLPFGTLEAGDRGHSPDGLLDRCGDQRHQSAGWSRWTCLRDRLHRLYHHVCHFTGRPEYRSRPGFVHFRREHPGFSQI